MASGLTACPSNDPPPTSPDVTAPDVTTDAADTTADADTGPGEQEGCCDITGVCALGEICIEGVCHPAPNSGCYFDGACNPGQTCQDAERCTTCGPDSSCNPVVGECLYGAGCCNADSECGAEEVCAEGVCRTRPTGEGACWTNAQCDAGLVCEGGDSCPCGVSGCTATPGYCGLAGACCLTDKECGDGVCVAGSCQEKPAAGSCFADSDCTDGKICAGAALCECGSTSCKVPTTPGTCLDAAEVVCQTHNDCDDGWICLAGVACGVQVTPEQCYLDAHCGPTGQCDGGVVCPQGETCEAPTQKGLCLTKPVACTTDSECKPGLRCAIPDTYYCPGEDDPVEGVCVPELDEGCWNNDDCSGQLRCASEFICTDPEGCAEPHKAGFCFIYPIEGDCCVSHRDCGPGFQCRNNNTTETCPPNATAVCVPEPVIGETCYNYFDCPAGLVCNNAFICACNARCWRSMMGDCELPSEQFCNANTDCGTDSTCARDWECLFNPCFNTQDCALGGKCQKDKPGQCWSHYDCEADHYCKGLAICPSNTTCPQNDEPGVCAPEEEAGACCNSYFACGDGTRCVSAATNTECVLDVSSTCVPFTQFNVTCYSDEDCADSRYCEGQVVCPCGAEDCTPQEGNCVLKGIGD